jgi:hypothetical protein
MKPETLEAIERRNEERRDWSGNGCYGVELEVALMDDIDALIAEVRRLRAIMGATDVPELRRALIDAPTAAEFVAIERRLAEIDAAKKRFRERTQDASVAGWTDGPS